MKTILDRFQYLTQFFSQEDLREKLGVSTFIYNRLRTRQPTTLETGAIDTILSLLEEIRQRPAVSDVSMLLPDLIPEYSYIAMHGRTPYSYLWSAFTHEPKFDGIGVWESAGQGRIVKIIQKTTGQPVDIPNPAEMRLNLFVIPYDEAGPAKALYECKNQIWSRSKNVAETPAYSTPFPLGEKTETRYIVFPGDSRLQPFKPSTQKP